jgi:hypothetical protein
MDAAAMYFAALKSTEQSYILGIRKTRGLSEGMQQDTRGHKLTRAESSLGVRRAAPYISQD